MKKNISNKELKTLKKVKKEVHKILFTLNTIEEKGKQLDIVGKKYGLAIGLANDTIGVFGIFVSANGKPLFADTSNSYRKFLKQRKEEFFNKFNKIASQVMWSIEKMKNETFELAKEYDVDLSFDEKNNAIIYNGLGSWLFFTEF